MAEIYLAFVDTPGLFAGMIRHTIRQKYVHVVLSMDASLNEAYSMGRRNPAVPLIAGFEREDKEKILRAFPTAEYMICAVSCTPEQKQWLRNELARLYDSRFRYHYAVLGLPFLLGNVPFYQKNHYTCASLLARLLEQAGVCGFDKHFSLVTPRDFYHMPGKRVIFEGRLEELVGPGGRRAAMPLRPCLAETRA